MSTSFQVLQTITHTKDKRDYQPGDVVSLDHLSEDDQQQLVRMGVVQPSRKAPTAAEPEPPKP